jgi:acyl carrier protein
MNTTKTRVMQILSKHVRVKAENFTEETSLEALGIDSLGMVEIIFDLEDEFDISIPESNDIQQRLKGFVTVPDVIQMVESLLEEAAEAK